jgi:hypothetical protein
VTVADDRGEAFDVGEPNTYLNDAVIMAPSMLLTAATSWSEVDGPFAYAGFQFRDGSVAYNVGPGR